MYYNYLIKATLFTICWMVSCCLFAQAVKTPSSGSVVTKIPIDSLRADSLKTDTLALDSVAPKGNVITAPIVYSANDSIVLTGKGVAILYGKADVTYGDLGIKSDYLRFNSDSSLIHAEGVPDTAGILQGKPVFKQGSNEYEMNKLDYNLKSKKSFIQNATTQQGEGFVTSLEAKKDSNNVVCMRNGWYTTCDNHDHPHFYLAMTKAKVTPGKNIVSGPAYLVLEDVPIYPLFIPFGYFPTSSSYSSGILMPSFGLETSRGYYLQGGGYYWAMSQYADLAIRGDYYANTSWAIRGQSKYKLIYKFSGGVSFDYQVSKTSEQGLNDYAVSKDFKIIWNHTQDAKANPFSTFSAGVNFSTNSYEHNNSNSIYNVDLISQNAKYSSITYTRRWPESPWVINASANVSQNSRDTTISASLPQVAISMARIYPFKRKNAIGNQRWYEKIGVNYSADVRNSLTAHEDEFMHKSLIKDWNNGVDNKINTSTSFKALNIFTISPSFNYEERWYSKSIERSYDDATGRILPDTLFGFNRAYDYSFSVGTSTQMYGFFRPWRIVNKLFGNKIEAIRHVMTPSVSMSYRPDFGDPSYGYYKQYETVQAGADGYSSINNIYSVYDGSVFGGPSSGKSGAVSFSLGNMVDMKLRKNPNAKHSDDDDDDDTLRETEKFKKITLLESLNLSTSYNMLADSMNWGDLSVTGRTTLFKGFSINFSAAFDPYSYTLVENDNLIRSGTSYWTSAGKPFHLTNAQITSGYSFSNDTFKKKNKAKAASKGGAGFDGGGSLKEDLKNPSGKNEKKDKKSDRDEYGYLAFQIPWNISINYTLAFRQQSTVNKEKKLYDMKAMQTLNFSGGISLTPKWKLTFTSGIDFIKKDLAYTSIGMTRDLHCWSLSGSVIPIGTYKSYNFTIAVSSSILQDLKWNERSDPRLNPGF